MGAGRSASPLPHGPEWGSQGKFKVFPGEENEKVALFSLGSQSTVLAASVGAKTEVGYGAMRGVEDWKAFQYLYEPGLESAPGGTPILIWCG